MNLKIGDIVSIHCYKHNGKINKTWNKSYIIDIHKEYLVLANKDVLVTKSDGRKWKTHETAILFFYYKHWFNIIAQIKPNGIFYYCNISSPFVIDNNVIKYIDYDLDLRIYNNGAFKILDRNEYNYHKRIMKYPKEINFIIKEELNTLINRYKVNNFPFKKEIINKYLEKFENIRH